MQFLSHRQKISLWLIVLSLLFNSDTVAEASFDFDEYDLRVKVLKQYDGLIIDSIEIENRKIFDTSEEPYDNFVFRTANKLHITTRKTVIARELLFANGDRFNADLAEETCRNLRNRYVIYDSWIEVEKLENGNLLLRLVTVDEWSFTGGLEINREGNEYEYEIGFEEENFAGLNQLISLDYLIREKDENYITSSFRDIRFLGYPYSLQLRYSDNPDAEVNRIDLSHPFYSLGQRFSYGISASVGSSRNEVFRDTLLLGKSNSLDDYFGASLGYRFGERKENVVAALTYNYTFERSREKEVFSSLPADSGIVESSIPNDSLFHLLDFGLRGFLIDFKTFKKIDGFGYTEDFTLGHTAAASYGRAFNPQFDDHVYDQLAFNYSFGFNFANELVYFSYSRLNKFKGQTDFQKLYSVSGNYYHRGPAFLTVAINSRYIRDWRSSGTESLTLGGKSGIRGFPSEFRTGNKMAVLNLESRFHPDIRLLSTVIGFSVFFDGGRTWKPNEKVKFDDFYFSGGVGLRFALDRSSKSRFFRLDLAYSDVNKWQISLGTGQYFSFSGHSLFLTSR